MTDAYIAFMIGSIYEANIYNEAPVHPPATHSHILHLASEQGRSRNSVSLCLVRIVSDTSVSALVSTRE